MAWQAERRGYKAPMDFNLLIQPTRERFADFEGDGEESICDALAPVKESKRLNEATDATQMPAGTPKPTGATPGGRLSF